MSKNSFCTIITNDYFPWAVTLYDSLHKTNEDVKLFVAIVDHDVADHSVLISDRDITILKVDDFKNIKFAPEIIEKYYTSLNVTRWALKSILLLKCLEHSEKVIYVDADIYFFNSYHFLFDLLNESNILLNPHWRPKTPHLNIEEYNANFKHGLFNGGFVGANRSGKEALLFWAESCLNCCEKNPEIGHYYDQTYLNLIPIYFDKIKILQHQGCNVASWNIEVCKRTKDVETKEILINNTFPIIFIHFTNVTIDKILKKEDALLQDHLATFNSNLQRNGFRDIVKERLSYFEKVAKESNENTSEKLIRSLKKIYYKVRYK